MADYVFSNDFLIVLNELLNLNSQYENNYYFVEIILQYMWYDFLILAFILYSFKSIAILHPRKEYSC